MQKIIVNINEHYFFSMASFTRICFVKSENQTGIWQFNITDKEELGQLGIELNDTVESRNRHPVKSVP